MPVASFPDYLDQHPLSPHAIILAVEDLFPRAEVEPAVCDCDNYLAPHKLPLHMSVSVVLKSIVKVL
jgi:hypothetical protein